MMFGIFAPGPFEIGIICVVGVLLFGTQLPKIARSVGAAIPSFKKGLKDVSDETQEITQAIKKL